MEKNLKVGDTVYVIKFGPAYFENVGKDNTKLYTIARDTITSIQDITTHTSGGREEVRYVILSQKGQLRADRVFIHEEEAKEVLDEVIIARSVLLKYNL